MSKDEIKSIRATVNALARENVGLLYRIQELESVLRQMIEFEMHPPNHTGEEMCDLVAGMARRVLESNDE